MGDYSVVQSQILPLASYSGENANKKIMFNLRI